MRYWTKISLLLLCFAPVYADDWIKLKDRADRLYGGWDTTVEVNLGYNESETTEKAGIKIFVYSKEKRISSAEKKMKYLEDGAAELKKISLAKEKIEILKNKADVLKALMKEEGIDGVTAYYDVMLSIAEVQIGKIEAEKKIEAMLK
jgi:uncharacterized protein YqfA (UPF0365 family)